MTRGKKSVLHEFPLRKIGIWGLMRFWSNNYEWILKITNVCIFIFFSRLYLNGDGMGRGTHISLFFVVMKSEYDNLLSWPFQEKVTFRLIHPTDPTQSVEENFQPDQNSSSFKQPTKEMNIAAGCPLFVPQDQLEKFIMDDCIYIETSIGGGILPR